jgi:hypothetical protein
MSSFALAVVDGWSHPSITIILQSPICGRPSALLADGGVPILQRGDKKKALFYVSMLVKNIPPHRVMCDSSAKSL